MTQGERISFRQQVQDFNTTVRQMKIQMEHNQLSQHLANSLTVVIHGSNDYINNYFLPEQYTSSFNYDPKNYADLLIEVYKRHILVIN